MPIVVANATTDQSPEPGRPGVQVIRVADVTRTGNQVGILLNAIGASSQMLRSDAEVGTTIDIDPSAREEARKTYALAHLRLRDIIDEQSRWGIHDDFSEPFKQLHTLQAAVAKREAELLQERETIAKELRRPCRVFGASVGLYPDREGDPKWVAHLGAHPTGNGLFGIGDSPEKAFSDFDQRYFERVQELAAREQLLSSPAEPEPPKEEQPEETPPTSRARRPRAAPKKTL